jgi:hypothetical protein
MLLDFFKDGIKVFLLRFFPLSQYKYHWTTLFGILLCLGAGTYLTFYAILGIHPLIIFLCFTGQILRCIILNETVSKILLIPADLKLNLFNFIVLTEAFSLILLLFYLFPQNEFIQIIGLTLSLWIYYVQIAGLQKYSQKPFFKVILAYFIYSVIFASIIFITINICEITGGISVEDIEKIKLVFEKPQ